MTRRVFSPSSTEIVFAEVMCEDAPSDVFFLSIAVSARSMSDGRHPETSRPNDHRIVPFTRSA